MNEDILNPLQLRELFHLEFLRWFGRKIEAKFYALKGGSNLRFFFKSFRYSEDMDLDVEGLRVHILKDAVMGILEAQDFQNALQPFGIERIILPDMTKAKQTETTQRFKVHLLTYAGEDLFTKIEFSRRGFNGNIIVQSVSDIILRRYKMPPVLVPHYDIQSAAMHKIGALAARSTIQARDIFDLFTLSSQCEAVITKRVKPARHILDKAYKSVFEISFGEFRDAVLSYLSSGDQAVYNSPSSWDEVKLKAANFIDTLRKQYE